jgi:hypothetical protein
LAVVVERASRQKRASDRILGAIVRIGAGSDFNCEILVILVGFLKTF